MKQVVKQKAAKPKAAKPKVAKPKPTDPKPAHSGEDLYMALHNALNAVSSLQSSLDELDPADSVEVEAAELKMSLLDLRARAELAYNTSLKQSFHPWDSDMDTMRIITQICTLEGVLSILEIGTCRGATTRYLHGYNFKVTTCDPNDQVLPDLKDKVEFINGTIQDVPVRNYDAAYIDGDHSYQGVSSDFKKCEEMGIRLLFIHDCYGIQDVKDFCEEQLSNPHYQGIMIPTNHASGNANGLAVFKRISL